LFYVVDKVRLTPEYTPTPIELLVTTSLTIVMIANGTNDRRWIETTYNFVKLCQTSELNALRSSSTGTIFTPIT